MGKLAGVVAVGLTLFAAQAVAADTPQVASTQLGDRLDASMGQGSQDLGQDGAGLLLLTGATVVVVVTLVAGHSKSTSP